MSGCMEVSGVEKKTEPQQTANHREQKTKGTIATTTITKTLTSAEKRIT